MPAKLLPPAWTAGKPSLATINPYQFVPLAAGFGLFLRNLSHFLFQVPYLPLHSFVLLLLSVFCSYAFISLLCHLLEVLFKATHQALRMWSQGQIWSPPQFYYLLFNIYENTIHKYGPKIQYRNRPAALSALKIQITNLLGAAQTINSIRKCIVKEGCFHFDFQPTNIDLLIYFKCKN